MIRTPVMGAGSVLTRHSLHGFRRVQRAGISLTRSSKEPYWACPESICDAIVEPPPTAIDVHGRPRFAARVTGALFQGSGELGGLDPQDLQAAYAIPAGGGATQTIAVIEAHGYEHAESDLATYRSRYGLSPCTKGTGCFTKLNENGEEGAYPPQTGEGGWETETALDLDMASAACPECRLVLVEANDGTLHDLGTAVDVAVAHGASEVSNSYGLPEEACGEGGCEEYNAFYDHPGVVVTVSAGDEGYASSMGGFDSPSYPATVPSVVSVGGTSLRQASNSRGWAEEAWAEPDLGLGSGGGCSAVQAKPGWQVDQACQGRLDNDVAAVGACATPVSVYNSAGHGWVDVCGTSVAAPLVAAIEAHASAFARSLPGAEAFYEDPQAASDVTAGSNGECPAEPSYLCQAEPGYDGPTGNGTPAGPLLIETATPIAATRSASPVTSTEATLNADVDPQGLETTYAFEYGQTSAYGASVPVPEGSLPAVVGPQLVQSVITRLAPETTYHFRVVAKSSTGTSYGEDQQFSTGVPAVSGIAPASGGSGAPTVVTITGTNLAGATSVRFGGTPAKRFTVVSSTSITATSPGGTGTVDVTVTTPVASSAVSTGDQFHYTLGPVLAWGDGLGLADGARAGRDTPVEMIGLPGPVQAVSTTGSGSDVLLADGTVMTTGANEVGQLGNGHSTTIGRGRYVLGRVCAMGVSECPNGPFLTGVTAIARGQFHTLAILSNGTAVAWGYNFYDELGTGNKIRESNVPIPVCTVSEFPCKPEHYLREVSAIAVGSTFSLALMRDGTVRSWGSNEQGQLGQGSIGTNTGTPTPVCAPSQKEPCAKYLSGVKSIAAGTTHSLALLSTGAVLAWGDNEMGQLGNGATKDRGAPTPVCAGPEASPCKKHLAGVAAIAGGWEFSLALMNDATVKSWGENDGGELGDGTFTGQRCVNSAVEQRLTVACMPTPVAVAGLNEVATIAAGPGSVSSLVVRKNGSLLTWGNNLGGSLGAGRGIGSSPEENSDTPIPVCAPYATGPCPNGPYLQGTVTSASAAGRHDLVAITPFSPVSVTGVSPASGPSAGGTPVTITGTDLSASTAVEFGTAEATGVQVRSATEITAVSPPGNDSVHVTVTSPDGATHVGPGDLFIYHAAPAVETGTPSPVGQTTATVNATVNPEDGAVSSCRFEYGPSTAYGASAPCTTNPGAGATPVAVKAALSNLTPSTTYHVRVVATNADGTSEGAGVAFTTLPSARPTVATEAPTQVGSRAATLHGTVNPEGANVAKCRFEYGPTTAYGSSVACSPAPGAGTSPVAVSASLNRLAAGSSYHYRLTAVNAGGASYGSDTTFNTPAAVLPELGRCKKVGGTPKSAYSTAACTLLSAGPNSGAYEWEPWPAAKNQFTSVAGPTTFSAQNIAVFCDGNNLGRGEATGAQTAALTITFVHCEARGALSGSCSSAGASAGEIHSDPLLGRFGQVSTEQREGVTVVQDGWELSPGLGLTLAQFSCGEANLTLTGAAVGLVSTIDEPTLTIPVRFMANSGTQTPEHLEGGQPISLGLTVNGVETPATLTMFNEAAFEEKLELKGTP
ncbi:MAG TPA: IPT/TIG domain-containing protein [Solirubrobacteraceae bacterium]|nr:IPT/TIG domain-containing protein [Solirubrobacteraceae bacterium]